LNEDSNDDVASDLSQNRKKLRLRRSSSDLDFTSTPRSGISRQNSQSFFSSPPLSTRRSHRGKNIDIHKRLVIIKSDTDVRSLFDLKTEAEYEEFQAVMEEDNTGEWSDDDESSSAHGAVGIGGRGETIPSILPLKGVGSEVMTPSVKLTPISVVLPPKGNVSSSTCQSSSLTTAKKIAKFENYSTSSSLSSSSTSSSIGIDLSSSCYSTYSSYFESYFDYDLSSDDILFLDNLKQRLLSSYTFENYPLQKEFLTVMNEIMNYRLMEMMIVRLEKELELSLSSYSQTKEVEDQLILLQQNLSEVNEWNSLIESFSESLNNEEEEDERDESEEKDEVNLSKLEKALELYRSSSSSNQRNYLSSCPSESNFQQQCLPSPSPASSLSFSFQQIAPLSIQQNTSTSSSASSCSSSSSSSASGFINKEQFYRFLSLDQLMKAMLTLVNRFIVEKNVFNRCLTINKVPFRQFIGGDIEIDWNLLDSKYYSTIKLFCSELIDYWITIRCDHSCSSFLRAYHTFIMPLWKKCSEACSLPSITDYNKEALLSSHKQLQRIRENLNRTRLIIDRVRRREKIKKELIKCSNDHLVKNILQYSLSGEDDSASGTGSGSSDSLFLPYSSSTPTGLSRSFINSNYFGKNRSMSLISETSYHMINNNNNNTNVGDLPRKRGRPRRNSLDSSLPPATPNATPAVTTATPFLPSIAVPVPSTSVAVSASSSTATFLNNHNITIKDHNGMKYIQGRDRNGKFLKKIPLTGNNLIKFKQYFNQPSLDEGSGGSGSVTGSEKTQGVDETDIDQELSSSLDVNNHSNSVSQPPEGKKVVDEYAIICTAHRDVTIPIIPFSLLSSNTEEGAASSGINGLQRPSHVAKTKPQQTVLQKEMIHPIREEIKIEYKTKTEEFVLISSDHYDSEGTTVSSQSCDFNTNNLSADAHKIAN
jgi:hypothetical protein